MKKEIKFHACEHLDFSDNYTANKEPIQIKGEIKLCWDRPVIDNSYPRLVQFCKKRGRMSNPELCTSEETKQCSDYNEIEHIATFEPED
jgi:hypothetical protein